MPDTSDLIAPGSFKDTDNATLLQIFPAAVGELVHLTFMGRKSDRHVRSILEESVRQIDLRCADDPALSRLPTFVPIVAAIQSGAGDMSKVAYAFHERNPEMVPDSTTGAPSVLHYILPVRAAAGSGQRDVLVGRPYLHCSRT